MENELLPDESSDESLADVPPTPVASAKGLTCGGLTLGTAALAVAGALILVSSQTTACRGSTRSSKLKFAQRQVEIEQALRERQATDESTEPTAAPPSAAPSTAPIATPTSELR